MDGFLDLIGKLEPANYEENLSPKILRVWDSVPDKDESINQYTVAVLNKFMEFSCIINAKLFRDTGFY